MKSALLAFWQYTKLLFKEWVLWLFLALGLIGLVTQAFGINTNVPQPLFWVLALVGFYWAGYIVFQELEAKIPVANRPDPPQLSVGFVEGSEYFYSIEPQQAPYNEQVRGLVLHGPYHDDDWSNTDKPRAYIVMHVRIENTGHLDVEILSIVSTSNSIRHHRIDQSEFIYGDGECYDDQGNQVAFPIQLNPGSKYQCNLVAGIYGVPTSTSAQFAALLRTKGSATSRQALEVLVDSIGVNGVATKFQSEIVIGVRPLYDLFIHQWQRLGKTDLLRLVGEPTHAQSNHGKPDVNEETIDTPNM